MIRAFITGWPVEHSLSPRMHTHWLEHYGIDGSYDSLAKSPQEVGDFLAGLPASGFAGGNVTIPHKEAAFRACAELDDAARAIGAVNTLWIKDGALAGSNTDAYGFMANLDDKAPGWGNALSALVLGAGGASRAVIHALVTRGFNDIAIANRSVERAEALAAHFGVGVRALAWEKLPDEIAGSELIVNTTSLGMKGQPGLEIDLGSAGTGTIVTDIVYTPLETPLLAQARERGLAAVDGLGMLLHQAVPGFEKWFGQRPEVDETLRQLLLGELARREAAS
ncbi:MAG: shikimate dehydrogenase [Salaquimonas sp.]|nr:shikimate dehydrogenase [Salaquimonas sp.]